MLPLENKEIVQKVNKRLETRFVIVKLVKKRFLASLMSTHTLLNSC